MAAGSQLTRVRLSRAAAIGAAVLAVHACALAAQDPPARDTLIEALPDSVREEFGQEIRREPAGFPERRVGLRGPATEVFECDRECIAESPALSLLDLLAEVVPGFNPLRTGYFSGPHHAFDGPFGPGFVRLYVDGREIPSLERAQTDLRALSLTFAERIRVYREAAGLVIDVETYRHAGPAYSRIGGATGSPAIETLQGVFANGLGSSFVVNGGFELLDATTLGDENDRFEAQARLSWMPRSNEFGIQLEYRTESTERTAADTAEVRRRAMLLRARANVGDRAQVELYGALSDWEQDVPGLGEDEEPPARGADVLGARISAGVGAGAASLSARLSGGEAYPSRFGELALAYPVGSLGVEGGFEYSSWSNFSATSWRAAVAWSDTLLIPFTLRAFGGSGDRGVGAPAADTAESIGFSAYGVGGRFDVGPFTVSGRYALERLDRPLGLRASFDGLAVFDSAAVDMTAWEARVEGPLIPIGALIPGLEPIRLRGFYRSNSSGDPLPPYVPGDLMRAELLLHDDFFDGNLELWISAFLERKGERLLPVAGDDDPVAVSAYTWPGGQLMIKIGDFRFFYRLLNPGAREVFDIPGATFPVSLGMFGIRWEFFN